MQRRGVPRADCVGACTRSASERWGSVASGDGDVLNVALRFTYRLGTPQRMRFAAQYPDLHVPPSQRFDSVLTRATSRPGLVVARYAFNVRLFHRPQSVGFDRHTSR